LFIEANDRYSSSYGLTRSLATEIVNQDQKGRPIILICEKRRGCIRRIPSPGGTTAEALFELRKFGLSHAIAEAMWACYELTIELGKVPRKSLKFFDSVGFA
jgi:pyrroline-5-carboxylate reductase